MMQETKLSTDSGLLSTVAMTPGELQSRKVTTKSTSKNKLAKYLPKQKSSQTQKLASDTPDGQHTKA